MKNLKFPTAFFLIFLFTIILPVAQAGIVKLDLKDQTWAVSLKQKGITKFNVCGDSGIQVTKKSLLKNFFIGSPARAYIFVDLPAYDKYWKILKTEDTQTANKSFASLFSSTSLWEVSPDGQVTNLGKFSTIDPQYKSTVWECIQTKKHPGGGCTQFSGKELEGCCSEKMGGLRLSWRGVNQSFILIYAPDPSIRLNVLNEKNHRYCHAIDAISF